MYRNGVRLGYRRMFAINADGSGMKQLSNETLNALYGASQDGGEVIDLNGGDDADGTVLLTRDHAEQASTGTLVAQATGLGVERVDTTTLRHQPVEQARSGASEYISDGHGTVRVMGLRVTNDSGRLTGRTVYLYRKRGDRRWLPLSTVTNDGVTQRGFDPYAVDRDLDVAYGFDERDGRLALYRIALDGSLSRTLVLDNPAVSGLPRGSPYGQRE